MQYKLLCNVKFSVGRWSKELRVNNQNSCNFSNSFSFAVLAEELNLKIKCDCKKRFYKHYSTYEAIN